MVSMVRPPWLASTLVACTMLLSMAVRSSMSVRGTQPPYWCTSRSRWSRSAPDLPGSRPRSAAWWLGQRIILAELNGLAVVRRNRVTVAELVMHQCRLCQIQQGLFVVGLHLSRHTAAPVVFCSCALASANICRSSLFLLICLSSFKGFIFLAFFAREISHSTMRSPRCACVPALSAAAVSCGPHPPSSRRAAGVCPVLSRRWLRCWMRVATPCSTCFAVRAVWFSIRRSK